MSDRTQARWSRQTSRQLTRGADSTANIELHQSGHVRQNRGEHACPTLLDSVAYIRSLHTPVLQLRTRSTVAPHKRKRRPHIPCRFSEVICSACAGVRADNNNTTFSFSRRLSVDADHPMITPGRHKTSRSQTHRVSECWTYWRDSASSGTVDAGSPRRVHAQLPPPSGNLPCSGRGSGISGTGSAHKQVNTGKRTRQTQTAHVRQARQRKRECTDHIGVGMRAA